MKNSFFIYPLLSVVLFFLFYIYTPEGTNRLPFYYTPDGYILPIGPGLQSRSNMVKSINQKSPFASPVVFKTRKPVLVTTNNTTLYIKPVISNRWLIIYDFKIIILFSFINLFTAIWILSSTRDLLISSLCFVQTMFTFSSYVMVVSHELHHFWIFSSMAMAPALLNTGLRTTGKDIPISLLFAEMIICLFFTLILFVGKENSETIFHLNIINAFLFCVAIIITLLMQVESVLSDTPDQVERYKRRILLFGTTAGIALPVGLFALSYVYRDRVWPMDLMLFTGVIFPLTLIYSTYRLHFVKFQLIITKSLMAGVLSVTLIGVYGAVLLLHSLLLPEQGGSYSWIVNVVFILFLVFFLDPARRYISKIMEKKIYRLDTKLLDSLKKLTDALAFHSRIQPTVGVYLQEIQETLDLEKLSFLFSGDSFPDLNIKSGRLLRVPGHNRIWKYLQPGQLRVSAYLSYAAGGREELFRFLHKNNYLLALGIIGSSGQILTPARNTNPLQKTGLKNDAVFNQSLDLKAALLIGYKKDKSKLKLNEIRYLQEASKLAGLLIYNYALLIQEIAKRRQIRELNLAGLVQRSLPGPGAEEFDHIKMSYINQPATSVTGDYLDVITLSSEKIAFMIGDVSGHGLGTGYIVSAARSIIRSHLKAGLALAEIVDSLNSFLVDRYKGGEFITLFIGILDAGSGKLEFINAAHPGPLIRRADGTFQELISTQRLIGVLPTIYHSDIEILKPRDRIYIFSDGLIETFNSEDTAFGDSRLQTLLNEIGTDPVTEIVSRVVEEINTFRGDAPVTDDVTFVVLEFTPQYGLIQNILSLIGLRKNS